MNTTSAKAVIEKWMGMLATGDMEAIAAMFTDDAVIDMPGTSDLPWAGRWRGRAKIDEYFKVMPAALEIREALIEAPEKVAESGVVTSAIGLARLVVATAILRAVSALVVAAAVLRAVAALGVDEVFEIFRDAHHQRHVQAALVSVAFAARQHAAVIAKVKDKRVLQQTIRRELFHHRANLVVDDLLAVEITRVRVAEGRRVRMIRRELHLRGIVRRLLRFHHALRKMQRSFV